MLEFIVPIVLGAWVGISIYIINKEIPQEKLRYSSPANRWRRVRWE